ncbi:hypothetical protein ACWCQ0_54510, partial [Streptomyces massasporeus]
MARDPARHQGQQHAGSEGAEGHPGELGGRRLHEPFGDQGAEQPEGDPWRGGEVQQEPDRHTGAWVGSRVARLATECWFREVAREGE